MYEQVYFFLVAVAFFAGALVDLAVVRKSLMSGCQHMNGTKHVPATFLGAEVFFAAAVVVFLTGAFFAAVALVAVAFCSTKPSVNKTCVLAPSCTWTLTLAGAFLAAAVVAAGFLAGAAFLAAVGATFSLLAAVCSREEWAVRSYNGRDKCVCKTHLLDELDLSTSALGLVKHVYFNTSGNSLVDVVQVGSR